MYRGFSPTWPVSTGPMLLWVFISISKGYCGPGSSVGIVTDNGLDGPGSNPGGDKIFLPVQSGPGAHPDSCKMGTGSFLGVKCGRGVLLTIHPLLVPQSWKSRAIPLPTLWATLGLWRGHFTFFFFFTFISKGYYQCGGLSSCCHLLLKCPNT